MTKDEYLYSYGNIRDSMKKICLSCQENERCKGCDIFNDLHNFRKIIHEHFELVEKVEWLKEEMTEPAFNLVFSTQEFLHSWYKGIQITSAENSILQRKLSCYENSQPYKFEGLKEEMWVWDDKEKLCNLIYETRINCAGEQEIEFQFTMINLDGDEFFHRYI